MELYQSILYHSVLTIQMELHRYQHQDNGVHKLLAINNTKITIQKVVHVKIFPYYCNADISLFLIYYI